MTLLVVPAMYLIAERLRRPMRNMFGGQWVSMFGLLPLVGVIMFAFAPPMVALAMILAFPVMMVATWVTHNIKKKRRRRKLQGNDDVNKSFIGSWF